MHTNFVKKIYKLCPVNKNLSIAQILKFRIYRIVPKMVISLVTIDRLIFENNNIIKNDTLIFIFTRLCATTRIQLL